MSSRFNLLTYSSLFLFIVLLIPKIIPQIFTPILNAISSITSSFTASSPGTSNNIGISWHAPLPNPISSLSTALDSTGTGDRIFNTSQTPFSLPYTTYNYCNMPHVRPREYHRPPSTKYILVYAQLIHRHHKRTPYAANTFSVSTEPWLCEDATLYHPPNNHREDSCEFPQITRSGLDDSFKHGRDLYGVFHDLLHLIPDSSSNGNGVPEEVTFRVTNNVLTSQVVRALMSGMFGTRASEEHRFVIHPKGVDSLEPAYPCPHTEILFASFSTGSTTDATWLRHLREAQPLFERLDAVSGVPPDDTGFHKSMDHYFDYLSARLCHHMPLPCSPTTAEKCITEEDADAIFRLGEWEYDWTYRSAGPDTLVASSASFGMWIGELAEHLRDVVASDGKMRVRYAHNVAHDGSLARLLGVLQVKEMGWPGMGAEVVFELYKAREGEKDWFIRILFSGQPLHSSSPMLEGNEDNMIPLNQLLGYFDGLVGRNGSKVRELCGL